MNEKELITLLRHMEENKRNSAEFQRIIGNEDEARYYDGQVSALGDVICALISPTYAQTLKDNYWKE